MMWGRGLDDPELLPVWKEIERREQVVFIHPHYGVGNEHFGDYGHTLFLALGFPFETTTAVSIVEIAGALYVLLATYHRVCSFWTGRTWLFVPSLITTLPRAFVWMLCFPPCFWLQIARLICSGTLDIVPNLKLLLAHSGGTLPFLAGRLDSCVKHDLHLRDKLENLPSTCVAQTSLPTGSAVPSWSLVLLWRSVYQVLEALVL